MGFPPPEDAPPPEEQAAVEADAGFEPSPTGATLCGFGVPVFQLNLVLRAPDLPFPVLPTLDFFVALNCNLSDPFDAEFGFGGGRVGSSDVDSDDEFDSP
jgi:hypothetical protein